MNLFRLGTIMGLETRKMLKVVQEELEKVKVQTKLSLLLSFFEKTKWFWLATLLIFLFLVMGYSPAEIVGWASQLIAGIKS